jgi:hypothetical protein
MRDFYHQFKAQKTSLEGRRMAFGKQNIVHHTPTPLKAVSDHFSCPVVHVKS